MSSALDTDTVGPTQVWTFNPPEQRIEKRQAR